MCAALRCAALLCSVLSDLACRMHVFGSWQPKQNNSGRSSSATIVPRRRNNLSALAATTRWTPLCRVSARPIVRRGKGPAACEIYRRRGVKAAQRWRTRRAGSPRASPLEGAAEASSSPLISRGAKPDAPAPAKLGRSAHGRARASSKAKTRGPHRSARRAAQ